MFSVSTDTAYAKNKDDTQWYHFDDSSVSSSSEDACVVRITLLIVFNTKEMLVSLCIVR